MRNTVVVFLFGFAALCAVPSYAEDAAMNKSESDTIATAKDNSNNDQWSNALPASSEYTKNQDTDKYDEVTPPFSGDETAVQNPVANNNN